jgi:hypothetical protein
MSRLNAIPQGSLTRWAAYICVVGLLGFFQAPAHAGSVSPNATGIYNALIGSTNTLFQDSGSITLDISQKGALTAKVNLGSQTFRASTSFLFNNFAAFRLGTGFTAPTIVLTLDSSNAVVTGQLLDLDGRFPFAATRTPYSSSDPAPEAGRYTLLLSPTQSGPSGQGNGFATMQVSPTGLVTIDGRSETGAPFSASAYVDGSGEFPFYTVTNGSGSLHGSVNFENIAGFSDCDGPLGWSIASSATSSQVSLIGSLYVSATQGALILPFPQTQNNGALIFGQNSATITADSVTLSSQELSSTSTQLSKLKLDARTGLYSGRLSASGTGGPFYGVAFQAQGVGAGLLLGQNSVGWMLLDPPAGSNSQSGGVDEEGSGTLTITNPGSYSGAALVISGSISDSPGAILSGTGTITIDLPINSGVLGGTFTGSPPDTSGTLVTTGSLTLGTYGSLTISPGLPFTPTNPPGGLTGITLPTVSGSNLLITSLPNGDTLALSGTVTVTIVGGIQSYQAFDVTLTGGSAAGTLDVTGSLTDGGPLLLSSTAAAFSSGTLQLYCQFAGDPGDGDDGATITIGNPGSDSGGLTVATLGAVVATQPINTGGNLLLTSTTIIAYPTPISGGPHYVAVFSGSSIPIFQGISPGTITSGTLQPNEQPIIDL